MLKCELLEGSADMATMLMAAWGGFVEDPKPERQAKLAAKLREVDPDEAYSFLIDELQIAHDEKKRG